MDIGCHEFRFNALKFRNAYLFSDACEFIIDQIGHFDSSDLDSIQFIHAFYIGGNGCIHDALCEGHEVCVLAHEVRLTAYAKCYAGCVAFSCLRKDDTFSCISVAAQCSNFLSLFPKPVNGGFNVAIGFSKCLTAIHHACACHLAQLVDIGSGDCYS